MFRVVICSLLILVASNCRGEEPTEKFLEGLLERQFYDEALAYLDQVERAKSTPAEFRELVPLLRGQVKRTQAGAAKDKRRALKVLAEATNAARVFLAKSSAHERALDARELFALSLVERARLSWELHEEETGAGAEPFGEQARELYDRAEKGISQWRDHSKSALDRLPKFIPNTDVEAIARRNELRGSFLQTALLYGAVAENSADTWPATSKARQQRLTAATERYENVYQRYRTRLAGLYARFYQARCLVKLDNRRRAEGILAELLRQPASVGPLRSLRSRVMLVAIPCWAHPQLDKADHAIQEGEKWIQTLRAASDGSGDVEKLQAAVDAVRAGSK